jgi:multidrug efflux pump subunit AcrB
MENIFRLKAKGYSAVKAAVSGTAQVAGAITASTLTTVCVFLPLVFVQGLTRQIFKDFGLTFAFALLASLLIALTLVPTVASGMFRNMEPKEHRWLDRTIAVYDKMLVWALGHKPVVLIITVVLLVGSAVPVLTKGFAYMPESSMMNQITVDLTMPKESTPEQRRETADEATARIQGVDGVDTVGMMSGGGGSGGMMTLFGGGGSSDMRNVTSYVLVKEGASATKVAEEVEKAMEGLDTEASVSASGGMDASMLGGSGITINLFGDRTQDLLSASKTVSDALGKIDGVAEIDDGMEEATPELHFTVDRAKAAVYGLTTAQVFQQVSAALTKESNATQVTWKGDSYNVFIVNYNSDEGTLTPEYIKSLEFTVTKRDGTKEDVKLSQIASVSETEALPSVLRSEQRRYLPVSITVGDEYNVTLVSQEVETLIAGLKLPAGVTYDVTGESSTIMDAFGQLGLMLLLGLLLVYLIMVAQFQSLKSPFIIMFSIPLAFTGGFLALLITDSILSVISLIGFAMLIGVIVANAIVLVDYINRLRLDGIERVDAIREGAATRMRPILMTALATIFALLVMALGLGGGSNMLQPLAIVCIGGLAYGTLMTLFVVPVIYDSLNKKELRKIEAADLVIDREA